ncbi:hypothetical protein [Aeromonas hydrophila]|uniref:hypothetical protein n=1 Tax=Aeromonas hydrophila TaxID=644 RepID=UPI000A65D30A|nr:hypothetical protein [Aeromonas hydrophila]
MAFIMVAFISSVKYMRDMVFPKEVFPLVYCTVLVITWRRPQAGVFSFSLSVYKHLPEYKFKDILVKVEEREPSVIWWLKYWFSNVIFKRCLINKCYPFAFCILSVRGCFSENFKAKEILMQFNISLTYISFINPAIDIFFILGIINEGDSLCRFFLYPFSEITVCENTRFNEVQKGNKVAYDVSNVVVTSKGRTFLMTFLLMNVSRKNSLLMGIWQFHMHHTMDFNMLAI